MSNGEEEGPATEYLEDADTMPHLLCLLDPVPFLRATPSPHVFISSEKVLVRGDTLQWFTRCAKQFNPQVGCLGYALTGYYLVYPYDSNPNEGDGHSQAREVYQALGAILMERLQVNALEETGIKLVTSRSRIIVWSSTKVPTFTNPIS